MFFSTSPCFSVCLGFRVWVSGLRVSCAAVSAFTHLAESQLVRVRFVYRFEEINIGRVPLAWLEKMSTSEV